MLVLEKIISVFINIFTLGYYRFVVVGTHYSMIDDYYEEEEIVKSDFITFKREFEKINWIIDDYFKKSLFADNHSSEFHASIILINGTAYKLTSFGFLMANILRRRIIKKFKK
jgi:hypothetical protein